MALKFGMESDRCGVECMLFVPSGGDEPRQREGVFPDAVTGEWPVRAATTAAAAAIAGAFRGARAGETVSPVLHQISFSVRLELCPTGDEGARLRHQVLAMASANTHKTVSGTLWCQWGWFYQLPR